SKDDQVVLSVENNAGQKVLTASVTALGTSTISIFDPVDSKEGPIEKVQINSDGITIFDSTGTDTTLTLTAAGNIIGTGQIQMGQNASSASATTVFGVNNTADGDTSTISGGTANTTSGDFASIGGGQNNNASGNYGHLGGGLAHNVGGAFATISGGNANTADGNYATIPGGNSNTAAGAFSFAAGSDANALHDGSFVWNDATGQPLYSRRSNQFSVRASGGFRILSNDDDDDDDDKASGVFLTPGNSAWSSLSNRAAKSEIRAINVEELLEKLATMPITKWKYIAEESQADHIGPMSQDFYSAFGLGDDNKRISTIDADGVALAAIQALHKQNLELKRELEELRKQVKELSNK
ncbi:MAG: tail fiber domain-containing protein, partial [Candidatus Zixiibacteriota bacterium]